MDLSASADFRGRIAGDDEAYDSLERQTLCRCGGSRNKPFCDGSHWYMGFKHQMGDDSS